MKSILTNIVFCIIALVAVIWLLQECGHDDSEVIVQSDTTYVHDTTLQKVLVEIPQPYAVYRHDTVYHLDSASCERLAQSFYERKYYRDTLMNDTGALIVVEDTVTQNGLSKRTLYFINRRATQVITNTTMYAEIPRFRFYAGPFISYGRNGSGIGAGILLSSKLFSAGYSYDITQQQHYLSLYFSMIRGKRGN